MNSPSTPRESTNTPPTAPTSRHGIPRRFQPTPASSLDTDADHRYWQLITSGPKSFADANELMNLGIRQEGTRNQVLMHLSAHLVFIRGYSTEQATAELITWAMNPRHQSKDIRQDLVNGNYEAEATQKTRPSDCRNEGTQQRCSSQDCIGKLVTRRIRLVAI